MVSIRKFRLLKMARENEGKFHLAERYLNLLECSSTLRRRRTKRVEVVSEEPERITIVQKSKNQTLGLVDGNKMVLVDKDLDKKKNPVIIDLEDKKKRRALIIDLEEEGVEKRECFDIDYLVREKRKRKSNNNGGNIKKKQRVSGEDELKTPPAMPEEFRKRILELFGEDSIVSEEFIMEKKTQSTDCSRTANRLLIPSGLLKREFLKEDERKKLDDIKDVKIIEPGFELGEVKVSLWKLGGQMSYVLNGGWMEIVGRNSIVPGLTVQLFCVRLGNVGHIFKEDELKNFLFVLVDITPPDEKARLIAAARPRPRAAVVEVEEAVVEVVMVEENGGGGTNEGSLPGLMSSSSQEC